MAPKAFLSCLIELQPSSTEMNLSATTQHIVDKPIPVICFRKNKYRYIALANALHMFCRPSIVFLASKSNILSKYAVQLG
jgi:hypothetical protein